MSSPVEACGAKFELRQCFIHLSQEDELRSGCTSSHCIVQANLWWVLDEYGPCLGLFGQTALLYTGILSGLFRQLRSVDIDAWVSALHWAFMDQGKNFVTKHHGRCLVSIRLG